MSFKPRIGILAGDVSNGLSYQRVHMFTSQLKDQFHFETISMEEALPHREKFHYLDAVILCHPYHAEQLSLMQRAKKDFFLPTLVDLDDLTDQLPSDHTAFRDFSKNAIPQIVQTADQVIVSTEYLKMAWGHLNENITVIENAIDERRYHSLSQAPRAGHHGFVVGWTGSQSHRSDLYNTGFIDGLIAFMEKYEDTRAHFHILCPQILLDKFGCRVVYDPHPVDFLDYPARSFLYPFDVCCVPLYDHPFNHAKSDLKLLEMAPHRIPVLSSPVENFKRHKSKDICKYSKDGDWAESLERIYKDRMNLKETADRAFQYVMNERTTDTGVAIWKKTITEVIARGKDQRKGHPMTASFEAQASSLQALPPLG